MADYLSCGIGGTGQMIQALAEDKIDVVRRFLLHTLLDV